MRFLIRTKENRISGPFSKEAVLAKMQAGELREADEVCSATGYWIYLHERDESIRMLGAALARSGDFHEEATETDTETVTTTQPTAASRPEAAAEKRRAPSAPVPTANRPESIRALKIVLALLAIGMILMALRAFEVARPF